MSKKRGYHCEGCGRNFLSEEKPLLKCPSCGKQNIREGYLKTDRAAEKPAYRSTRTEPNVDEAVALLDRWTKSPKTKNANEQTVRHALVSPFLEKVLGYDSLSEIEYGVPCGQGFIDYELNLKNGKVKVPIEVKKPGGDFGDGLRELLERWKNDHGSDAGWVTDGVNWRMYLKGVEDLKEPNKPCEIFFERGLSRTDLPVLRYS